VKTRTREDFGRPFDAVDRVTPALRRQAHGEHELVLGGEVPIERCGREVIIAERAEPRLELIRNAFGLSEPYIY